MKLVNDMNDYIELFEKLKGENIGCSYSQLTALCGVYLYSAMRDWAVDAKKRISEMKPLSNEIKDS
jgi:hypothetical protein